MNSIPDSMVVYGLRHISSEQIRYVGYTTLGAQGRLKKHLSNARLGRKSPVYDWIRSKLPEDIIVEILDTCTTVEELETREKYWIKVLITGIHDSEYGLNFMPGGIGGRGYKCSPERVAKMSGENAYNAHFTSETVKEIRAFYLIDGQNCTTLAEKYGISSELMGLLLRNKTYYDPHYAYPGKKNKYGQFVLSNAILDEIQTLVDEKTPRSTIERLYGRPWSQIKGGLVRRAER